LKALRSVWGFIKWGFWLMHSGKKIRAEAVERAKRLEGPYFNLLLPETQVVIYSCIADIEDEKLDELIGKENL